MENMADDQGRVTDDLAALYCRLARGGSGLIITGAASVAREGRVWPRQLAAWDDGCVEGLSRLAAVIHASEPRSLCAVQLHHGGAGGFGYSYGGRAGQSSLADWDEDYIASLIDDFSAAARRVVESGFDAVAVHGAHGYLVSQFFSPLTNPRRDGWGGSLSNRLRFPLELCRAVRAQIGPDPALLWKLNVDDFLEGGAGPEEYAELAKLLVEAGVDLVELSGGIKDQIQLRARLAREAGKAEAYFGFALERFRRAVGAKTLAVTGGLRSLRAMEAVLDQGADMAGLSRPLISEPDLPRRLQGGPDRRPARCTSCNRCLLRIAREPLLCPEFDATQRLLRKAEKAGPQGMSR
jgi:2,4-dienoyl-CoA reductase-like NADH-dependent reductase (Old Yellow Enzyme family)